MTEAHDRLQQARRKAGFSNATDAARAFGWNENTYRSHENGERGLRGKVAARYAEAFKVAAGWLLAGDQEISLPPSSVRLAPRGGMILAPIAGVVQGGLFREAEDFGDFQHEPMAVAPDPDFPEARQVVFIVEGDSMNDAKPTPILPGSKLVCVDFDDIEMPIRNGWKVVVERTRDGGSLREWSVKEVHLTAEEVEFHPRSSNPRHKPFKIPLNANPDDGQSVKILALVREIIVREKL